METDTRSPLINQQEPVEKNDPKNSFISKCLSVLSEKPWLIAILFIIVAIVVGIIVYIYTKTTKESFGERHGVKEQFKTDSKATDEMFNFAREWLDSVTGIKYA